ncbi:MAG TPA: DNA polymerase III subunit gamma/tau, partial [Candidatus Polarisedimenticolia bacterium]
HVSYQVLARKYRPQTFEEVVGQAPIVTTLRNAVEQSRIHHAYLFSGLRGVGKTTVARLFAKALNCVKGPTATPCNVCASCSEIAASRSLDVLEIDGASNRGIDAVRELRETVRYAPARDRNKVYIIDEVHMLTTEAWNALLKTLEEPPAHVVFIFATTEYRKIPLTILSRCQHFEFRKIAHAELLAHLAVVAKGEEVSVPPAVLDLVARIAEGSLRDAQSALDQVIAFSGAVVDEEQARTILGVIDRELVTGFFDAVKARDCERLLGIVETIFDKGYQPVPFLEDLMGHGRDLLLARVLADPSRRVAGAPEEIRVLTARASAFTEDELLRLLELLTREEPRLKGSAHPRFLLEALAIKMTRLADLRPLEELIARLEGSGQAPADPRPSSSRTTAAGSLPARPAPATAPAASPAAATLPAPADGGGMTDGAGMAVVEAILKRVHEERAALGGFLGQASWVEIRDGALRIAFLEKHSFFREKVQSRDSAEYLKRVAREVSGRDLVIQVSIATPAPAGPGAAGAGLAATAGPAAEAGSGTIARPPANAEADETRKRRLKDEALREPAMQKLLETFGGEIVDVDVV